MMHIEELIHRFLRSRKTELSEKTQEAYRYKLIDVLQKMGIDKTSHLTKARVVDFVDSLINEKQKTATIENKLYIIKSFSNWLFVENLIEDQEYKKIKAYHPKLLKGEDNRRALTPKEELTVFRNINNPMLRMLFFVGINYGLRRQEYINLKIEHVDLRKKY